MKMKKDSDVLSAHGLRWFVSEFVGTLILALTVGVSVGSLGLHFGYDTLYVPFIVGGVVALLVYLLGSVSGAHFNPAVTLALFAIRKVSAVQVAVHVIAQIAGAYLGLMLASQLVGELSAVPQETSREAHLGEIAGAFILVFAVTRVVLGRVQESVAGLVIGLSLAVGLTVSLGVSGGILNPAIAMGLGAYHLTYLLAPFIGGLLGAGLAWWLDED